jgi:hypothetical protein
MKLYYTLLLLLVGCGSIPDPIFVPVFTPVICEDYGHIRSIHPLPVIFVSGTDRQGNQILGLRGDQYSNLSLNSQETILYIKEQKKAISYYKSCIENHNSKQEEGGQ